MVLYCAVVRSLDFLKKKAIIWQKGSSLLVTVLDTDGGSGADAVLILVLANCGSTGGSITLAALGVFVVEIFVVIVKINIFHLKLADALGDGLVHPLLEGGAGSAEEAAELATAGATSSGAGVASTTKTAGANTGASGSVGSCNSSGLVTFADIIVVVDASIQVEKLEDCLVHPIDEGGSGTAETAGKLAIAARSTSGIVSTAAAAGTTTTTAVGDAASSAAAASAAGVEAAPGLATAALTASHC